VDALLVVNILDRKRLSSQDVSIPVDITETTVSMKTIAMREHLDTQLDALFETSCF
jgi:hypothetical protein